MLRPAALSLHRTNSAMASRLGSTPAARSAAAMRPLASSASSLPSSRAPKEATGKPSANCATPSSCAASAAGKSPAAALPCAAATAMLPVPGRLPGSTGALAAVAGRPGERTPATRLIVFSSHILLSLSISSSSDRKPAEGPGGAAAIQLPLAARARAWGARKWLSASGELTAASWAEPGREHSAGAQGGREPLAAASGEGGQRGARGCGSRGLGSSWHPDDDLLG